MSKDKLKPCPFCGGDGMIVTLRMPDSGEPREHYGCCIKCNATSAWSLNKQEAIDNWNRRVI